jgi:hypothetical protein
MVFFQWATHQTEVFGGRNRRILWRQAISTVY